MVAQGFAREDLFAGAAWGGILYTIILPKKTELVKHLFYFTTLSGNLWGCVFLI
jgi:hypothetical protein